MQQVTPKATCKEICELYQISRQTLWRMAKNPDFPAPYRIGRAVRWDVAAVDAFLSGGRA